MAADMLKAHAAIERLRIAVRDGTALPEKYNEPITDLCETFVWLEESRAEVMKERDKYKALADRCMKEMEDLNAQITEWSQTAMERNR